MSHDTRQDYQAQPRYGEPPPDETRGDPRAGYETPVDEQARDEARPDFETPTEEQARDERRPDYEVPVGEDARDEASPRYDPPAWHDAETADRPVPDGPSDLDAAESAPVSAQGGVVTPVGTAAPPQAVDTPTPPVAVGGAAVESPDDAVTVWHEDAVHDFQQRWREVQLRFVDDPRAAADEAQQLVAEALDRFSEAVTARKGELDGWQGADGADTERMRTVVRRYRKLLDRLLEV
jgi:hypothetical protein